MCIYTSKQYKDLEENQIQLTYNIPGMHGIQEQKTDQGRINFNRTNFLSNSNMQVVHLHPTDDGAMAISPNNCCFLLDMSMPVNSFILLCYFLNGTDKCAVFQINIVTQEIEISQIGQSPFRELLEMENEYLKLFNVFSHLEKISDIQNDQINQI